MRPRFIAEDFKAPKRVSRMTHIRTNQSYPQSNGKMERFDKWLKGDCICRGVPLSLDNSQRIMGVCVNEYN